MNAQVAKGKLLTATSVIVNFCLTQRPPGSQSFFTADKRKWTQITTSYPIANQNVTDGLTFEGCDGDVI
jgi:hypothetical protein